MSGGVQKLLAIMPFLFGIGFIAPLIAQVVHTCGLARPGGLSPIGFGLLIGGSWGLVANLRGRWV